MISGRNSPAVYAVRKNPCVHKEYTSLVYNHFRNSDTEEKKMKKHYIRLTAAITSLILIAFILAGGFFTYVSATKTLKDQKYSIQWL